jgi:hypothetical protein
MAIKIFAWYKKETTADRMDVKIFIEEVILRVSRSVVISYSL